MKIYDISMAIEPQMPVYNNSSDKKPVFTVSRDFSTGTAYETDIKINLHTGTHIDAPLHMIQGGSTIDKMDISRLLTDCTVYDFTGVADRITAEDLKKKDIRPGSFILSFYIVHTDYFP